MTCSSTTEAAISEVHPVVDALHQALGSSLVALALFGSRARGDALPDSDWDLLLIAEHLPASPLARQECLIACLPAEWRGRAAIIARTPSEFTAHLPSLYLDIAIDGIVLYDRDGSITRHLAALRSMLDRQGLYRIQRDRDLVWEWRTFPGYGWRLNWQQVEEEWKRMNQSAAYRLKLASGFVTEARQDIDLQRWRSAVDNAQLASENAAKSVLSLVGPLGRTHQPGVWLREALARQRFPSEATADIERLATIADTLGMEVHIKTDYGAEEQNLTPWDLFDESQAREALTLAEEALAIAQRLVQQFTAGDQE
ncbi:MAG: nucleotidyltransferase domain-containing protein [Roseiflexaceae bacterium]|nr:nucleotidyltransferase domain-containing protein [Roseiflexaceae bacterium]